MNGRTRHERKSISYARRRQQASISATRVKHHVTSVRSRPDKRNESTRPARTPTAASSRWMWIRPPRNLVPPSKNLQTKNAKRSEKKDDVLGAVKRETWPAIERVAHLPAP